MNLPPPKQRVRVGKITGVHGIRGMLKALPDTDDPASLLLFQQWHVERGQETVVFQLEKGQVYQEKGLLLKFEGIDTPEAARLWVGSVLYLDRDDLPALAQGYYWADLEGLEVYNLQGVYLGKVVHLFETGANDVMVVKNGPKQVLIPYVQEHVVVTVDLLEGKLIVDWEDEPDAV